MIFKSDLLQNRRCTAGNLPDRVAQDLLRRPDPHSRAHSRPPVSLSGWPQYCSVCGKLVLPAEDVGTDSPLHRRCRGTMFAVRSITAFALGVGFGLLTYFLGFPGFPP
jgi:hypothetical protein